MPRGFCGRILHARAKQPLSLTVALPGEGGSAGCILIKGGDAGLRVHVSPLAAGAGS